MILCSPKHTILSGWMCYFFLSILLTGCDRSEKKQAVVNKDVSFNDSSTVTKPTPTIQFHHLAKDTLTGDFDGDGRMDTIVQHNYSQLRQAEIEQSPDPYKNDWDDIVHWYYQEQSDIFLVLNKAGGDTLHLGPGQGLYCLLNLGDVNADGKDEIALSVIYCDYSQLNSCKIVGLCKGQWTELMYFSIHEGAFVFEAGEQSHTFTRIPQYLEKKGGKWFFMDYQKNFNCEIPDAYNKMAPLKTNRCP